MVSSITMPALSPTMTEGSVARWLKQPGDSIQSGDTLLEVETDKATMEVEAVDEGTLAQIIVADGTGGVAVGEVIGVIKEEEDSDADVAAFLNAGGSTSRGSAARDTTEEEPTVTSTSTASAATPASRDAADSIAPEPEWNGAVQEVTVREALRDAIAEEMRRDELVFLMGEEVAEYEGAYKVSQGLLAEFGDKRVIDTPITEHGFAGIGVGAAFGGLRPIIEFMTFNFAMQAIDQIINSAAKTAYMSGGAIHCPIVFRGPNGAASRVGAQHSQCYASWYGHCPGLKVIAPYSAADSKGLLKAAIRDPNPVIFLEHELVYSMKDTVPDTDDWTVPIGKARIVRSGSNVTLVAFARMVGLALEAAERLAEVGIAAEVIDLRTIRPLDFDTLADSLTKTHRMVTIEEGWPMFGVGAEIAAEMSIRCFDQLDAPVVRVAGKDVPMPYAVNLEKLALPSLDDVVTAARRVSYQED
ncbi:MAG: pyruvate dehydrogenase complex E1 component subunit beta [Alphaproteobacteria bacterium]|nr:pyruvate dehydrogenase complex E1 component subunit beta [Alphaproteobacteria bacterium]